MVDQLEIVQAPARVLDLYVADDSGEFLLALHCDGRIECGSDEDAALAARALNEGHANGGAADRTAIASAGAKLLAACADGRLFPSFAANISPEVGGWSERVQ